MGFKKLFLNILIVLVFLSTGHPVAFSKTIPETTLVWLRPEYQNYHLLLMESVDLNPATSLPAEVKVAIPKGSTIEWVGEVNRTDPSKDFETVHKINHMNDYDEVVFTLKQNRTGQVEVRWDNALSIDGTKREIILNWVQRYESKNTVFLFRLPEQAANLSITPLKTYANRGPDGSAYYETDYLKLKVGQEQQLKISYSRDKNAAQQGPQSQSQRAAAPKKQTDSIFVMTFGTALVVLILTALIFRARNAVRNTSYEEKPLTEEAEYLEDEEDECVEAESEE